MTWTSDIPTEVGEYWFFGETSRGSMGCHYRDPVAPYEQEMVLVYVWKCGNGLLAVVNGQCMPMRKFDKRVHREGCVGYWAKAEFPALPPDSEGLFVRAVPEGG